MRKLAQERVPQTVDALEMFEEQNQPLKMRALQFSVDAVKGMSDGVCDFRALQIPLQRKNVIANDHDIVVLFLRDAPDQDVDLAGVLRKISCDLLADKSVGQIANCETAIDRVVIGDGDEIHSAREQFPMQLPRI